MSKTQTTFVDRPVVGRATSHTRGESPILLHDQALALELDRLQRTERAERDRKAELAKRQEMARFD